MLKERRGSRTWLRLSWTKKKWGKPEKRNLESEKKVWKRKEEAQEESWSYS
jgi:hypothetical protein